MSKALSLFKIREYWKWSLKTALNLEKVEVYQESVMWLYEKMYQQKIHCVANRMMVVFILLLLAVLWSLN